MNTIKTGLASLILALGTATGASALTTITFDTVVTAGEDSVTLAPTTTFNGETGSGSVTYNEALGVSVYDSFIDPDFAFSLTMFGQVFSSSDDSFDSAVYNEGTGDLFFNVSEIDFFNPINITLAGIESFFFDSVITPVLGGGNQVGVFVIEGDGTCTTNCGLAPVPVPAALPLALAGFGLMGWVSRRRPV